MAKEWKILLADDIAAFLNLERSFLRRAECTLLTAADGAQALKLAKTHKPHLLLLDIEMPKMTGIEVCRILRQDPAFARTPIVMVTAAQKRREEALQAGATEFWVKPIEETSFLAGIQRLIPIKVRKEERLRLGIPVQLRLKRKTYSAFTRDLSLGGGFILLEDPLPLDEKVSCTLTLMGTNDTLETKARIVRAEITPDRGVGVEFLWEDPKSAERLKDYLKGFEKEKKG
jgi:CheY-like chemotaxis protein/Tfp pilus assembly protein PilZ